MVIDENTKVIARLHTKCSPRGLNIYNPYFQEAGVNALFILFYDEDPRKLIDGITKLKFAGAVTVGFETDPEFPKLLSKLDVSASDSGRVGFVKNINGEMVGYNQGGDALLNTCLQTGKIVGKKMTIVGAGNLARKFLFTMEREGQMPESIEIYNQTASKAEELAKRFKAIRKVGSLNDFHKTNGGDILVNITDIGGKVEDTLFTENMVKKFKVAVDVTFEKEDTNLVLLSKKLGLKYATGWDMFTHQGKIVLETILDIKVDPVLLKKHVINGLSEVVK